MSTSGVYACACCPFHPTACGRIVRVPQNPQLGRLTSAASQKQPHVWQQSHRSCDSCKSHKQLGAGKGPAGIPLLGGLQEGGSLVISKPRVASRHTCASQVPSSLTKPVAFTIDTSQFFWSIPMAGYYQQAGGVPEKYSTAGAILCVGSLLAQRTHRPTSGMGLGLGSDTVESCTLYGSHYKTFLRA